MQKAELDILSGWKIKIAILTAIVVPTITATGAFYDLRSKISEKEYTFNEKLNAADIENRKTYVDKESFKEMRSDIKEMRQEMAEIKSLLMRKPQR